jgi:hypothetical protein
VKKKVAATRIIAAAETRISVVVLDLAGCFGCDDGDVTLAAGAEGAAAGTVAACVSGSCGCSGGVATSLGGTTAVGTFPGGTAFGRTGLGGIGLVSVREGFGALVRGT